MATTTKGSGTDAANTTIMPSQQGQAAKPNTTPAKPQGEPKHKAKLTPEQRLDEAYRKLQATHEELRQSTIEAETRVVKAIAESEKTLGDKVDKSAQALSTKVDQSTEVLDANAVKRHGVVLDRIDAVGKTPTWAIIVLIILVVVGIIAGATWGAQIGAANNLVDLCRVLGGLVGGAFGAAIGAAIAAATTGSSVSK